MGVDLYVYRRFACSVIQVCRTQEVHPVVALCELAEPIVPKTQHDFVGPNALSYLRNWKVLTIASLVA